MGGTVGTIGKVGNSIGKENKTAISERYRSFFVQFIKKEQVFSKDDAFVGKKQKNLGFLQKNSWYPIAIPQKIPYNWDKVVNSGE